MESKLITKDQLPTINSDQEKSMKLKTPDKFLKHRPGRGGKTFTYVEVGYVINKLNEVFKYLWDWDITEQQAGKTQVWVKGKLTVKISPELSITKTAFGGSQIKADAAGNAIDIGDDFKAAAADALKKAASMIGIAADVYYGQLDRLDNEP